ncbi:hypothetical protein L207DRAFT_516699 [Hyaloscypha variabilis F]|uniref:Uncharacterized protein n=1 Tax=Hyaloscypha variabilis (strain UAMH 11265 / GT02V1 / F) TaxID=1149755 RepID=A0A2J6R135_HYAVF|nr:hypothetical protein L207DRAFT_519031 [Hyaloscypha variabilis F]PMD34517.1 hypothetical protein L207DRAFT_516699 [Hyaloscypha variabilis F]
MIGCCSTAAAGFNLIKAFMPLRDPGIQALTSHKHEQRSNALQLSSDKCLVGVTLTGVPRSL